MSKKNPTSVAFTDSIQKIKDDLASIYGLQNVVSSGILLFSELTDAKQKEIIRKVNVLVEADREALGIVSASVVESAKQKQKSHQKPSKAE